jgi:hypothetical protein
MQMLGSGRKQGADGSATTKLARGRRRGVAGLILAIAATAGLPAAAQASEWEIGDVFANTPDGATAVKIFDNNGNFKEAVGDPAISGEGTGCAFDANMDLYATFFQANQTVKFDHVHPHGVLQTISNPGTNESIVFDAAGNFYVGMADPTSGEFVRKYDPAGNLLDSYTNLATDRGADWIDLAVDQTTLFYDGEGPTVRRYDLATHTQLPDFATIPGSGNAFAVRILPPGDGSSGVLVADGADIKRLDGAGNVVQTYDAPGVDVWFALNLDPNGTSFWSANLSGGQLFRFNIETGAVEVGPIQAHPSEVAGLCVLGELTAAVPPPQPPGAAAGAPLTFDITGRKKQKPVGPQIPPANKAKNANGKLLSVKVTCQVKPCTVDLNGKVKAPGEKVKLKTPEISLQPGETKKVRLRGSKQLIAELKADLRAGEKGKAKITGTATAPDGEKAQDSFKVKLRG